MPPVSRWVRPLSTSRERATRSARGPVASSSPSHSTQPATVASRARSAFGAAEPRGVPGERPCGGPALLQRGAAAVAQPVRAQVRPVHGQGVAAGDHREEGLPRRVGLPGHPRGHLAVVQPDVEPLLHAHAAGGAAHEPHQVRPGLFALARRGERAAVVVHRHAGAAMAGQRHELEDLRLPLGAAPARAQHERAGQVGALHDLAVGDPQAPLPVLRLAQQGGEYGRGVEPGQAQPRHVPLAGDERPRVLVGQVRVVLDERRAAGGRRGHALQSIIRDARRARAEAAPGPAGMDGHAWTGSAGRRETGRDRPPPTPKDTHDLPRRPRRCRPDHPGRHR